MSLFSVRPVGHRPSSGTSQAFLINDNWNDWFRFRTLFGLIVFDAAGTQHDLGGVKIGQLGMPPEQGRPNIPETFDTLDESFFSLGQDDSYYETLNGIEPELRHRILHGLRDVAADPSLLERVLNEDVTRESLLRSVSELTVRGQFTRLARGDARLTPYNFSYQVTRPTDRRGPPLALSFKVIPESLPPTNIHVLIGRNGVGKTYLLHQMTNSLIDGGNLADRIAGHFVSDEERAPEALFANLVFVTFSAFDPVERIPDERHAPVGIRYAYIGLQRPNDNPNGEPAPKSPRDLALEFSSSAEICRHVGKVSRWRRALEALEADPLFKQAELAALGDGGAGTASAERSASFFEGLSSGHKVVLLTITRLVETVDERTLVLLDEPEAHLHPPLLSAFVRALSDLLVQRNGVAIVATHSPVVLQEVPKTCVWKLRRVGGEVNAERPEIETFGENVGVLTREIFGLEVTDSGFHRMLRSTVGTGMPYESVQAHFGGQLGAEALAIVRAMIATRGDELAS